VAIPSSYKVLVLAVSWFFYLGNFEYWINLLPLPIGEAVIHTRMLFEFEASSRGIFLGLVVCAILPSLGKFSIVVGSIAWFCYTFHLFSWRFVSDSTNNDDSNDEPVFISRFRIDLNVILIDTFKQLNILIYRLLAKKYSAGHSEEKSIRNVLSSINESLTTAKSKITECNDQYCLSVTRLTKNIVELENAVKACRHKLVDCRQNRAELTDIVEKVQEDVVVYREFFDDVQSQLQACRAELKSRRDIQFYWKIASFCFFPLVIGFFINKTAIRRTERLMASYSKQLALHEESIEQSSAQEEELTRKETATDDVEQHLSKQLKKYSDQLSQKELERKKALLLGENIKNMSSFLTRFQSKVFVMYKSDRDGFHWETVATGVEDIVNFLESYVQNINLTQWTTQTMLDNFRHYYLKHD